VKPAPKANLFVILHPTKGDTLTYVVEPNHAPKFPPKNNLSLKLLKSF
jgi:hypothetical protein